MTYSEDYEDTPVTWSMKSTCRVSIESYYCYRLWCVGSDIRDKVPSMGLQRKVVEEGKVHLDGDNLNKFFMVQWKSCSIWKDTDGFYTACCLTIPDQYLDSIDIQSIGIDTVSDKKWQHIEKIDVIPLRKI